MDFKSMTIEEMEARKAEIAGLIDTEDADLTALEDEVRSINEELETRKEAASKREELRKAVATGAGDVIKEMKMEETHVKTIEEVRNSQEYIDAFARYIQSEDDRECRALLTEYAPAPATGTIPVPVFVEDRVRTAWENNPILARINRTYFRGVVKVPFEISADPAQLHKEGAEAIDEEELVIGTVTLIPAMIKKYITMSDEVSIIGLGGSRAFLDYIYDEITYQITKLLADTVVQMIASAGTTSDNVSVGVPVVQLNPSVLTIPTAVANLSADADNLVVVMNRLTEVAFLSAAAAGNFMVDPFAGLPRIYSNALPAYDPDVLTDGDVYAFVGDLRAFQVNYPEGDGVIVKVDDSSLDLMKQDLIGVLGREYVAPGITSPGRLVNIAYKADGGGE